MSGIIYIDQIELRRKEARMKRRHAIGNFMLVGALVLLATVSLIEYQIIADKELASVSASK